MRKNVNIHNINALPNTNVDKNPVRGRVGGKGKRRGRGWLHPSLDRGYTTQTDKPLTLVLMAKSLQFPYPVKHMIFDCEGSLADNKTVISILQ